MQHLSTAFLIIALVIAVNEGGVKAEDDKADQVADESKNRAVTIVDGPKYVEPPVSYQPPTNYTHKPEQRPPSKPPHPAPDKPIHNYVEQPRPYHGQVKQKGPPPRHHYSKPLKIRHKPNSVYKMPRVIPLPPHHRNHHYTKQPIRPSQQLVFAASTGRPVHVKPKMPKFSVPVETINGIRADFVRPPKSFVNSTSTTTTTTTSTTTQRPLRNKRIWPKRLLEKKNTMFYNKTATNSTAFNTTAFNTTNTDNSTNANSTDLEIASATHFRFHFINNKQTSSTTTFEPPTVTRGYRRVSRVPKHRTTTVATDRIDDINITRIEPNDWVPIVPSHYTNRRRPAHRISKRSDTDVYFTAPEENVDNRKRMMYLQSYGLIPVPSPAVPHAQSPLSRRKKMVYFRKRQRPLIRGYSGYSTNSIRSPAHIYEDHLPDGSHHHPSTVTRIKHHHHHHHHRYVKTVEKPIKVPYKVEVPKPYPVPVEKKVPVPVEKIKIVEKPYPYPVQVEKRVPYPVQIKVPHPVPYKVVEKEYIPKPYPIVHHVPVLKHVEVKVPHPVPFAVEKRVPYPVEVQVPVPVDRPVPVPVEKPVPYPVHVKVLVPQPYPVEKKVPYPVEVKVKEPVEVVKHVPVRVPYPQPYPVKVPTPVAVPVEKRVPYPVEVEKKVPVPYKVIVPQKVEVEKRIPIPIYVPRPYQVEKKVPVPVKVPYPVKVPVYTPIPAIYYGQQQHNNNQYNSGDDYNYNDHLVGGGVTVSSEEVTHTPHHTVTVHGNTGFAGFQSRIDVKESSSSAESTESTTESLTTSTTQSS